ncbi:MAG TPA: hypothetical protein VEB60_02695 [Candidatus Paceibacterota bacterium]|nr:hypothetical protein [Candidatus Paceibacterota bacterium]
MKNGLAFEASGGAMRETDGISQRMLTYDDLLLWQFGYLLLLNLWRLYGLSGVSGDRSLRGAVLDSLLLAFPPKEDFVGSLPDKRWQDRDWLLQETRERLGFRRLVQLELFSALSEISLIQYGCLASSILSQWYLEDSKRPDPLAFERRIVEAAFHCFGGPAFIATILPCSWEDFLEEGKERYRMATLDLKG